MNDERKVIGCLKIDKNVLATIGKLSALEVKGVSSIKHSKVDIVDGFASLTFSIIFNSDVKIPELATKIQNYVKDSIQSMTGITVSKVNIIADGIKY